MAPREAPPPPPHASLELVHVLALFRHGDRSPITRAVGRELRMDQSETSFWVARLPTLQVLAALNGGAAVADLDARYAASHPPDKEQLRPPQEAHHGGRWPCGQLTDKGVDMMRDKGRALRQRYDELLKDAHPTQHVHVQSTNIRRTIRSAQSVLAGMFPERFPGFDGDSFSQQDPSFVVFADEACAIAPQHSYELFGNLSEMLAFELKHNAPAYVPAAAKRIRELIGVRAEDQKVAWTGLREVLICRRSHGLPVPEGITEELFRQVCDFDAWLWFTLYGKRKFCFASFHKGVQRVYEHLRAVADGTLPLKLSLFSGHDNSLVALICALELRTPRVIPPYGAMLTFELYRSRTTGEMFIRPLFEGEEVCFAEHQESALCPFSVFESAVLRFMNHSAEASKAAL